MSTVAPHFESHRNSVNERGFARKVDSDNEPPVFGLLLTSDFLLSLNYEGAQRLCQAISKSGMESDKMLYAMKMQMTKFIEKWENS